MIDTLRDKALQAHTANLERLVAICQSTLTSSDRLASLHLNAARALMDDVSASVNPTASVTNIAQHIAASAELIQPLMEKATAYSRELLDIMNHAQETLGQIYAEQHAEVHAHIDTVLEHVEKVAPAGTEPAVAALKSVTATAKKAHQELTEAAKQIGELTRANIATTLDHAEKSIKKAQPQKGRKI